MCGQLHSVFFVVPWVGLAIVEFWISSQFPFMLCRFFILVTGQTLNHCGIQLPPATLQALSYHRCIIRRKPIDHYIPAVDFVLPFLTLLPILATGSTDFFQVPSLYWFGSFRSVATQESFLVLPT